ncbi:hypothetical protein HA402_009317 [Bradysia odoriphaga]|nr:hypothetical protein HA402_009317 [Bradysia odoriphaga]
MYLLVRKLLRGADRKAVEADKKVVDYKTLVALLKKEFNDELSSYEIHRTFIHKKKLASESLFHIDICLEIGMKIQ